jgi:hypothetical protein
MAYHVMRQGVAMSLKSEPTGPLKLTIESPCAADWALMQGNDTQRFCEQCNKHVYNLSEMTQTQAEYLLQNPSTPSTSSICARFSTDEAGYVINKPANVLPTPTIDEAPFWFFARHWQNATIGLCLLLCVFTANHAFAENATTTPVKNPPNVQGGLMPAPQHPHLTGEVLRPTTVIQTGNIAMPKNAPQTITPVSPNNSPTRRKDRKPVTQPNKRQNKLNGHKLPANPPNNTQLMGRVMSVPLKPADTVKH